ncbi:MAG: HNH endonuclease [Bdellovibrionales bacterium]|nr:HNH endonuclease [Bdellovibrionales bacterium]
MAKDDSYHVLDPAHTDPARIKKERDQARKLKKTQWWLDLLNRGICHHCQNKFKASELTMDHLIPLARGGKSNRGNIVPSCRPCNQAKHLESPVDAAFRQLEAEKSGSQNED